MARSEAFAMSKRVKETYQEEEQFGLLQQDESHYSNDDDDDMVDWDYETTTSPIKTRRRNWFITLVIAVPVVWLFGFIFHTLWMPKKTPDASSAVFPAQLRTEKDYILDSKWDFDAAPKTREYHWTIAEYELNPDGVYRTMILINATFPGPLIECNEGDEIVVHVHNQGTNATSIHWHGLFQNGTNYMDGTVGVTQCPIAPGYSFTYRFNVSGQSGTYWYHSHMAMQASDGLVGPIVIHAKHGDEKKLQKVPYEEDRVVLVSDHYYDLSSKLLVQYLEPGNENDEPVPQAALINGRGLRNCKHVPDRNCSSAGRSNALFDLSSEHNTRLRFINVGNFAEFQIQLDEHEFQLTEVDGVDVYPQSIHRLNINPAQRYSIIVTPPQDNKGLYWLRARMITHCFSYEEPELAEEVRGILRYSSSSTSLTTPRSKDWPEVIEVTCKDLNTTLLTPVLTLPPPSTANDFIYLRASFQIRDWRLSRGYLNESSYRTNTTHPTLSTFTNAIKNKDANVLESLSSPSGFNTILSPRNLIYQTSGIKTIDILVQNMDDGNHPFHLHGHTFWILAEGTGYAPDHHNHAQQQQQQQQDKNNKSVLNLENPLRRDTASLPPFGWLWIRFVADNPGVWAFHCHIGWHMEAGLGMLFLERSEVLAEGRVPENVEELCGVEGIERGKGPNEDMWVGG